MMIKTAKVLAISLIILLSANLVQAQGRKQQGPPPVPNKTQITKMVTELSKILDLNNVKTIELSDLYNAHFKEVSAKIKASRPEKKEMEALNTKFENKVKALLTKSQQKKFDTYIKSHSQNKRSLKRRR